jgi:hypothetical protein
MWTSVSPWEEEEEEIYNPLKLPLGWDGKPIPYWLYKLHGRGLHSFTFHLNVSAFCGIGGAFRVCLGGV